MMAMPAAPTTGTLRASAVKNSPMPPIAVGIESRSFAHPLMNPRQRPVRRLLDRVIAHQFFAGIGRFRCSFKRLPEVRDVNALGNALW